MKRVILLVVLLSSCASQRKVILTAPVVSMTKYSLNTNEKVVLSNEVEGQFCAEAFKEAGSYGLIDEAIKDAQNKASADFLYNASISQEGNCTYVTGTVGKIRR
jgi:hypothetical protein